MRAVTLLGLSLAMLASAGPAPTSPAPPPGDPPQQAQAQPPLDAQVWTAEGKKVQLSSFWGKPTVVIYESRGATEVNRQLKDALWHRGKDPSARGTAQVVGIVSLPELDWFPARVLAERAVRERQAKVGIPVLIDWKGTLTGGAWQLNAKTSSVMVLDAQGHAVYRASGALDSAQVQQVFGLLQQMAGGQQP